MPEAGCESARRCLVQSHCEGHRQQSAETCLKQGASQLDAALCKATVRATGNHDQRHA